MRSIRRAISASSGPRAASSPWVRSSSATACRDRSSGSISIQPRLPSRIAAAIPTSRSVIPDIAETTTTGRVGAAATSRASSRSRPASATDVPPNFQTTRPGTACLRGLPELTERPERP